MRNIRIAALLLAICSAPYILCDRGGQIAYYDTAADMWHETGVCTEALVNEADRAALTRGLTFSERAALTRALEDYCS